MQALYWTGTQGVDYTYSSAEADQDFSLDVEALLVVYL